MISVQALIGKFRYALDVKGGYIYGKRGVLWTAAKQEQLNNTTESKYEQGRKYGARWIGHYVWDCSGLFAWAFAQLGGYMYHGSNTMYLKYCDAKGTLSNGKRTDGKELLPGTAVFVWNEDEKKYSHVGLYIGDGNVIEAASTISGVIVSSVNAKKKNKAGKSVDKWANWGELKGVDYSGINSPSQPDPAPIDPNNGEKPVLKKGDRGDAVKEAQTKLIKKGYSCGSTGADGIFGKNTEAAVKQFQTDSGLLASGEINAATWAALDAEPVFYTVTIPGLSKIHAEALVANYPGATMTKEGG